MSHFFLPLLSLLVYISPLLSDGEVAPPSMGNSLSQTLIMLGVAVLFFYLILWRPEKKKQRALQQKREEVKVDDQIVTIGGIVGKVSAVQEKTVIIQLGQQACLEVLRTAISDVSRSEK